MAGLVTVSIVNQTRRKIDARWIAAKLKKAIGMLRIGRAEWTIAIVNDPLPRIHNLIVFA